MHFLAKKSKNKVLKIVFFFKVLKCNLSLFEGVSSDQSSVEVDGFVVDSSAVLDEKLDVVFVNTA